MVLGLFVLDFLIALVLLVSLLSALERENRGTNAVSRFVRSSASYAQYGAINLFALGFTIIFTIIGLGCKAYLSGIPTLMVIPMSILLRHQNTKKKNRVKDARLVTKGALQVGGKTGGIGTAVAVTVHTGNPIAGVVAGKAVNDVMQVAASNMCDVNTDKHPEIAKPSIEAEAVSVIAGSLLSKCTSEEFLEATSRLGIDTEGKSVEDISKLVLQAAPTALLDELPEDMSDPDKAMSVLSAQYNSPMDSVGKCDDPNCIYKDHKVVVDVDAVEVSEHKEGGNECERA